MKHLIAVLTALTLYSGLAAQSGKWQINGYLYLIGQPEASIPNRQLFKINLFKYGK